MRIGINCFNINPSYTGGINSYTLGLLNGFAQGATEHEFIIFVKTKNESLFSAFRSVPHFEFVALEDVGKAAYFARGMALLSGSKKLYKQVCDILYKRIVAAFNAKQLDFFYTPTTFLFPYNINAITVASMHDIQHVHYPHFFPRTERLNRKMHFGLSADLCDYFQASSNFMKEDLMAGMQLPADRIFVVPEGVAPELFAAPRDVQEIRARYSLPEHFLFLPAGLWHHKNHITVLKALKQLIAEKNLSIPLVMTGARKSSSEVLFNYIKTENLQSIRYLGAVPYDDLIALYQAARYVITPGLYESSCLPALEAAAAGVPVISSAIPPNIEMAEKLRLNLFEPLDVSGLANLLWKIWDDEELRRAQINHNRANVGYYSWENAAKKYIEKFSSLLH
jgi:glycosyltransferase involved in cell wall biosynthesis